MTGLGWLDVQAWHQIVLPGPARELRVRHADEMTPGGERRQSLIGLVDIYQMLEMAEQSKLQQLRKDFLALVHDRTSSAIKSCDDRAYQGPAISDHRNRLLAGKARQN